MVLRPQWRLFPCRPCPVVSAADHGSGLWVRGGQCRGAEPLAFIVVELGQAAGRGAPLAARFWLWHPELPLPVQSQSHCLYARLWRRDRSLRRQFVADSPGSGTRPLGLARPPAGRASRAQRFSADRRTAVPPHLAGLQLLLVRAPFNRHSGRETANRTSVICHSGHAAWLAGPVSPAQPAAARERRDHRFFAASTLVRR